MRFLGTKRFQLVRQLGVGGMGVVYEAQDIERDERVALKTLECVDANALYRLKNEFRALHDFVHPNLIRLRELIQDDGHWFFTMDLIRGVDFLTYVRDGSAMTVLRTEYSKTSTTTCGLGETTLGTWTPSRDNDTTMPLDRPRAVTAPAVPSTRPYCDEQRLRGALTQLTNALIALHRAGKVHRDVKPSNILITADGHLTLLDFGLITDVAGDGQSLCSRAVGTPAYMAPEQALAQTVGPEVDWYSVGVLLYEALTGRRPFVGTAIDVLAAKQHVEPPQPRAFAPNIDDGLNALCMQLLAFAPAARPTGMQVLEQLGGGASPSARSTTISEQGVFVGRNAELAELQQAFEQTRAGQPMAVYMHGESGVGKSALVRHFVTTTAATGNALVLSGRCYESEAVPYSGFDQVVDELSNYMSRLAERDAAQLVPRHAGLLPRVFPVLGRVEVIAQAPVVMAAAPNPYELRSRAFRALRELLFLVAERRPLIVTIDDFQWADADSLLLISELLAGPEAPPLLLLIVSRHAPEVFAHQRASNNQDFSLAALGAVRYVAVAALQPHWARELAERLLQRTSVGGRLSAAQIAAETRGHPLYINELVRHAAMFGDNGRDGLHLQEVIWNRLSGVPEPAVHVLELIVVAGTRLSQATIRRAAKVGNAEFVKHLSLLRVSQLVRSSGIRDLDTVEPYHDQVRESMLKRLDEARRTHCHRRLAIALESEGTGQEHTELLFQHWRAAGEPRKAAEYGVAAARQAEAAFAFECAAELYQSAISVGEYSGAELRSAYIALGDALANAGHGADAADAYLQAAAGADATEWRQCQQRAVLQLLVTGHLKRGMEILGLLLADIGMRLPATPRRAILSLIWQRTPLMVWGLQWSERSENEIAASELVRFNIYQAMAKGLASTHPILGAYFQTCTLRLALQLGERSRIAQCLIFEAVYLSSIGRRGRTRGRKLLQMAQGMIEPGRDIALDATFDLGRGAMAYLMGRYASAANHLRSAEILFRDQVVGALFELTVTRQFLIGALRELGAFTELQQKADVYLRDAVRRGDLLAQIHFRHECSPLLLVADQPGEIHRYLDDIPWPSSEWGYHMQHWYDFQTRAELCLYEGTIAGMFDEFGTRFAKLQRAQIFRYPYLRAVATALRGRLCMAHASSPGQGQHCMRRVMGAVRRLEKVGLDCARVWALQLRAGIAAWRGETESAVEHLGAAVALAERQHMGFAAAASRLRKGQLMGGDQGQGLVKQAETWMRGQRIVKPERMVNVLLPGLGDCA